MFLDNQQAALATSRESLQLVQDALQEIEEVKKLNYQVCARHFLSEICGTSVSTYHEHVGVLDDIKGNGNEVEIYGSATFHWPGLLASEHWLSKTLQLKLTQQNTSEYRKTVTNYWKGTKSINNRHQDEALNDGTI